MMFGFMTWFKFSQQSRMPVVWLVFSWFDSGFMSFFDTISSLDGYYSLLVAF